MVILSEHDQALHCTICGRVKELKRWQMRPDLYIDYRGEFDQLHAGCEEWHQMYSRFIQAFEGPVAHA
jgi:hypothetical protein